MDQLCVLNGAQTRLRRWGGASGPRQSNGRKAQCASDCARTDDFLQGHDEHLVLYIYR
jgi:hypothetical protein